MDARHSPRANLTDAEKLWVDRKAKSFAAEIAVCNYHKDYLASLIRSLIDIYPKEADGKKNSLFKKKGASKTK